MRERFLQWLRPATYLRGSLLTLFGAALTTSAALTMVAAWVLESTGREVHPYAGILLFWSCRACSCSACCSCRSASWRSADGLVRGRPPLHINLRSPEVLRALTLVGLLTVINVVLMGVASYKGVEHMESNAFCGTTCHEVMQPEYTAFLSSPHSRVGCVQCHIGPGARLVRPIEAVGRPSGIRGRFNTHSRPIPSPVHNLRPARETCEQCHWPQKFHGDRPVVIDKFAEDETNTAHEDGADAQDRRHRGSLASGIHGHHLSDASRITYVATDDKRQIIPRVTWTDEAGKTWSSFTEDAR